MERLIIWIGTLSLTAIGLAPIELGGPASFALRAAVIMPLAWLGVIGEESAKLLILF